MNVKDIIRKAFIKSLPVLAAYIVLGTGFGILMSDKGYSPLLSVICSLFIFAGSMQYVAVDLFVNAASPLQTALMTLMVNARHLFYGISMVVKYRDMHRFKGYLIFGLTDEAYSLLCNDRDYLPEEEKELYCFLVTAFNQSYWVIGTALGALIGTVFNFNTTGIDFSMTALFVTVYVDQWMNTKEHSPALFGIGATFLCLILFGGSRFLIPAMLLITILLTLPYLTGRGKRKPGESGSANATKAEKNNHA